MQDFLGSTGCCGRFLFSSKGAVESHGGVLIGTVSQSAFRSCAVNKYTGYGALPQAMGRRRVSVAMVFRTWCRDRAGHQGFFARLKSFVFLCSEEPYSFLGSLKDVSICSLLQLIW